MVCMTDNKLIISELQCNKQQQILIEVTESSLGPSVRLFC